MNPITQTQPILAESKIAPALPHLEAGPLQYLWHEDWAKTPDVSSSRENGRTHGAAVTKDGSLYVFHQAAPALLRFDSYGELVEALNHDFERAHGLTLVEEDGEEFFWLTDQASTLVAKVNLRGETVQTIEKPEHPLYAEKKYSPTWVAVSPVDGIIFVADGYGASLVHAYTRGGEYLYTLTGEEGAGRFKCPHSVFVDTRGSEPELLIADRGNERVQVYGLDGQFRRVLGGGTLNSPCAFATWGEYLFIPELFARLAVFGPGDKFIGYLGDNSEVVRVEGWPNHAKALIQPGKFNSPHGIAAGPDGNLYIVEWIIGGRIIKLEKVSA